MADEEQLTFMPEHRIEPPECFGTLEAFLDEFDEIDTDFCDYGKLCNWPVDMLAENLCGNEPEFFELKPEDVARSIRIYRERQGDGRIS